MITKWYGSVTNGSGWETIPLKIEIMGFPYYFNKIHRQTSVVFSRTDGSLIDRLDLITPFDIAITEHRLMDYLEFLIYTGRYHSNATSVSRAAYPIENVYGGRVVRFPQSTKLRAVVGLETISQNQILGADVTRFNVFERPNVTNLSGYAAYVDRWGFTFKCLSDGNKGSEGALTYHGPTFEKALSDLDIAKLALRDSNVNYLTTSEMLQGRPPEVSGKELQWRKIGLFEYLRSGDGKLKLTLQEKPGLMLLSQIELEINKRDVPSERVRLADLMCGISITDVSNYERTILLRTFVLEKFHDDFSSWRRS